MKYKKVKDVQLDRGQETVVGTLHLTVHHLIFSYDEEELWVRCKNSNSVLIHSQCFIDTLPHHTHCRETATLASIRAPSFVYQMSRFHDYHTLSFEGWGNSRCI